nr:SDR family NAD(P)-dependent oxidoreductase [Oceanococcus sp. HetDA_MAG_MS8]
MKQYKDHVAAITGAGSGMGRELARLLAAEGCHLALCDVDEDGLAQTAASVNPGVTVTQHQVDVGERDAIYTWAEHVLAEHGRVDLLFNNAGVALSGTLEGSTQANLEWITNINYWGVVHGCRAFLPALRVSGRGQIVNTSSVSGLIAQPGMGAYNATKFAVRGFSEALRMELELEKAAVGVTCVHPGGIKTAIARKARFDPSVQRLSQQDEASAKQKFEELFITSADKAARTILKAARKNKARVLVGPDAVAIDLIQRLLPTGYQALVKKGFARLQ